MSKLNELRVAFDLECIREQTPAAYAAIAELAKNLEVELKRKDEALKVAVDALRFTRNVSFDYPILERCNNALIKITDLTKE